jgi:predicted cation transporter
MDVAFLVNIGLLLIFLIVMLGPFLVTRIERNLEIFLFLCGVAALTVSGFLSEGGEVFGWSTAIVTEALTAPLVITTVFGIPVGIVQIVLLFGLVMYIWYREIQGGIDWLASHLSLYTIIFVIIVLAGLLSSIISAILAAIILVEMVCALPMNRGDKVSVIIIACFSIGLGAALTPLGEPLSTIAVSKLAGPPYYAGFTYLFNLLGMYIIPGIIAFGCIGVLLYHRSGLSEESLECHVSRDTLPQVGVRALKVYIFIMGLIFLGEGFKPLILQYIIQIPPEGLFWANSISAILDNATLTAAEISPVLTGLQIKSALMGLIIAGGMLIPGNIPNIIAAGKLGITSKEWAKIGVPVGILTMFVYFLWIFVPVYLAG